MRDFGRWILKSIHLTVKIGFSLSSCLSGVDDMDFNVDKFLSLVKVIARENLWLSLSHICFRYIDNLWL